MQILMTLLAAAIIAVATVLAIKGAVILSTRLDKVNSPILSKVADVFVTALFLGAVYLVILMIHFILWGGN